jgi:diguanylate cyclase (GGDEF)-like protein
MSTPSARADGRRKRGGLVRNFALLKTPLPALMLILSVEAACVTWLGLANASIRPAMPDIGRFILLLLIALAYAEGARRVEMLRRYIADVTFANASSLWCFAAALTLPVGLAGAFAAALHLHNAVGVIRSGGTRAFQVIYVAATEIAATMIAAQLIAHYGAGQSNVGSGLVGAVAVLAAMLSYAVVQQALVSSCIYLATRPVRFSEVVLSRDDETLEFATLALAALFGVAVVHAPYLSTLVLVLIVVLRRSALVRELEVRATRDAKTGLLNAGAWRQEAERELARAERTGGALSVLMIDLDHFKLLNDEYGHPAGDATLRAVADCLSETLRGYDAVGRFGGEEFVALLVDTGAAVSKGVAERLCQRIGRLELAHGGRITASIGVGVGVAGTHKLDRLIAIADKALYAAKDSGRNQVRVVTASAPAQPVDVVAETANRPTNPPTYPSRLAG